MLLILDFSDNQRVGHILGDNSTPILTVQIDRNEIDSDSISSIRSSGSAANLEKSLVSLLNRISISTNPLQLSEDQQFSLSTINVILVIASDVETGESLTRSLRSENLDTDSVSPKLCRDFGFNQDCRVLDYILDIRAIHLSVMLEPEAVHVHLGDYDDLILPPASSAINNYSTPTSETFTIQGAGLARSISKDLHSNSSFQLWTSDVINSPIGGKAGVDDKRFLMFTEVENNTIIFHRFEYGQRVQVFSLPDFECRILFESQLLEVRRLLSERQSSTLVTKIILSASSLRPFLPSLSRLISTVIGTSVYTLQSAIEDHLLSGAFQHVRIELSKLGNLDLVDGLVSPTAIVLSCEPDRIFAKYYAGIMTEYERIRGLLNKGLI